ncbi:MAG TPA: aldehyde dehydrogenase family protein, partial [bacterium]|nr:aldehyde dehydrogenase family protein [bacterium]
LAFIGSTRVCNTLKRQHPRPNRLRSITGMGAKNPAFIFPDADLDVAVRECVTGALSFNGQRCTAVKMIHVHQDVERAFVDRLVAAVDALKAGMPWEPGVQVTPLPEHGKPAALARLADDAVARGARIANAGGGRATATYYAPAVLHAVTPEMEISKVEQFGPLIPVDPFESDEELIELVTKSPFGQQCAIFGRDPQRIAPLVDALVNQVARINLNTQCRRGPDTFPFTGRKDSAEGTLSVSDALRSFSIRTVVATSTDPSNKELVGEIVTRRLSRFLSTDFLF